MRAVREGGRRMNRRHQRSGHQGYIVRGGCRSWPSIQHINSLKHRTEKIFKQRERMCIKSSICVYNFIGNMNKYTISKMIVENRDKDMELEK